MTTRRRVLSSTIAFLLAALAVRLPVLLGGTDTQFAVLSDDALGVLENVLVGYYHDYVHRQSKAK